jgi:hypothetical protein
MGRAPITWSSAQSTIASVSPGTGTTTNVAGQGSGTTTVTATSGGTNDTVPVTVTAVPGPTVTFVPPSNTHFTSAAQTLVVRGCHPTLPVTDAVLTLNGGGLSYTQQDASAACGGGFGSTFTTTVSLPTHLNTLAAHVSVQHGTASTAASATYWWDTPAVAVTPKGASGGTLLPGQSDTLSFTVNNPGNASGVIQVAPGCPAGFTCTVIGSTTFTLGSAQVRSVPVAFTAGGTAGVRTVSLTATLQAPASGSDAGSYQVTVGTPPPVPGNVAVTLGSSTLTPGTQTTATAVVYDTTGAPMSGQSVTWTSSVPGVATVASTGALTATVSAVAVGTSPIQAAVVGAPAVTGSAPVTVETVIQPTVLAATTVGLNPGTTVDRGLCLTIALGESAVAQCGDLRVAHALPALRGRGGVQQPVLLYTSATAHPIARLAAHVWYTSGARPDSIRATLRVGGVVRRSGFFHAAAMVPGVAMRLMIGWDTHLQATGIYPYALELTPYGQGAAGTPVTVSDTFVVVNRRASHVAAGWWLAGLEQLLVQGDGSLLWLGGDGSAKRYASAGTNVWVAPSLTVADTITRSGSVYTRHAPGQVAVRFNGQGNHVATVRPLGDSTRFTYSSTGTNPQLASVITRAGQTITFG